MKRYIKSSSIRNQRRSYVSSSRTSDYTNHYTYNVGKTKFSVYTKYEGDPENFQCQIVEIHPYDDADYYWIKKDSPASASLIKNGKRVGYVDIDEWDEDEYESADAYVDSIVDYMCRELRDHNKNIKPVMVHN